MIKQNILVSEDYAKINRPLQIIVCDDEEIHNQNLCRLLTSLDRNVSLQLQSFTDAVTLLDDLKKENSVGSYFLISFFVISGCPKWMVSP